MTQTIKTIKRDNEGNDIRLKVIASRKGEFLQIRDTVQGYLERLDVPFIHDAYDQKFYDQCIENMVERGWSSSTIAAARIFLLPSLAISRTAYTHINHSAQIFVAIYTTLMIYLDDIAAKQNMEALKSFSKSLLQERSHGHEVLDAIAEILREIPQHYGDLTGSIILSATLRYITSIVMEEEVPSANRSQRKANTKFPRYLRELSGIPEAYAMFIFPPSIPYTSYVQAIPDMTITICYGNDILSLYKEELTNDQSNLISLLAASKKLSKLEVHKQVTEEALECDKAILDHLEDNEAAKAAYMNFRKGYIAFHTCLSRYRLRELLDLQ